MRHKFSNSFDLLQKAEENKVYEKLIVQMNKDFVLANIPFSIPLEITLENLPLFLKEKIYHLIMEDFNDYLNLLYVVDVSEQSFINVTVTDAVDVAEQVAFLILQRELQKVDLKEKYRTKD